MVYEVREIRMRQLLVVGGTYATLPPVWGSAGFYELVADSSGDHIYPPVYLYRFRRDDAPYPYVVTVPCLAHGRWYGCPDAETAHAAFEMACDRMGG